MGYPYYIKRAEELICYLEINKPGAFLRIEAPRQMGKTSLLAKICKKLETILLNNDCRKRTEKT
nr:AAA-like domain-containing protein [Okeania sp. SIO3I5]